MSQAYSISTRRRFGLSRVCGVWGVPRATVYRHRAVANGEEAANTGRPPKRRGPQGACSDAELLSHIEVVIAGSRCLSKELSADFMRRLWFEGRWFRFRG